jgi:hypothetical protein
MPKQDIKEKKMYEPGSYLKLTPDEKNKLYKKFPSAKTLKELKDMIIVKCLE